MHRYLYVNQNPTKYFDPLGYQCTVLQPELTVAGVVAAYVTATYDSTTKVVKAICDWAVDAWDGIVNSNTPEKTEDSTKNGKGVKQLPSPQELQNIPLEEFNPDDYGLIKNPYDPTGRTFGKVDENGEFSEDIALHPKEGGFKPKRHRGKDHYHLGGKNTPPIFVNQ